MFQFFSTQIYQLVECFVSYYSYSFLIVSPVSVSLHSFPGRFSTRWFSLVSTGFLSSFPTWFPYDFPWFLLIVLMICKCNL